MGGRMDCNVITQISRVYRLLFLLAMVLHFARLARGSSRYYTIKEKKHDAFGSALKSYLYWGFSMKHILTNTFQTIIISGNQEHNYIHKSRRCSQSFEMRGIRDSLQHIHRHLHNTNHIVRIRQTLPANSLTTQKTSINSFYNLLER